MVHYAEDVAFNSPTVIRRWGHADGWLHGKDKLRAHFEIGLMPGSVARVRMVSSCGDVSDHYDEHRLIRTPGMIPSARLALLRPGVDPVGG